MACLTLGSLTKATSGLALKLKMVGTVYTKTEEKSRGAFADAFCWGRTVEDIRTYFSVLIG